MTLAVVFGGRGFCETHDAAGRPIPDKTLDDAMDERRALGFALDMAMGLSPGPFRVVQGGAHGADRWARIWCERRGVPCDTVEADWSLGRRAGPERNQRMVDRHPDVGVRFPGGRGTADCAHRLALAGVEVFDVKMRTAAPR